MLLAFVVFVLGLMLIAFAFKRQGIAFGAIGGWIILGVYAYTQQTGVWDIYYGLWWLSMGMVFVMGLEAWALRSKEEEVEVEEEDDAITTYTKKAEAQKEKMDRFSRAMETSGKGKRSKRRIGIDKLRD